MSPDSIITPRRSSKKLFSQPGQTESHYTDSWRLDIKGPSLHHELKVLRVWECPSCGRVVRAGGKVTARRCDCADQTQMKFSDAEPLPPADVSEFITYMTPEYQEEIDDGTDLPLPDIASLVMPALEPRGRRSRPGKPLRDTIAEATPAESEPSSAANCENQAFGDGLDVKESAPQAELRETSEADPAKSSERSSEKSKPRRRRRSRGRGERGDSSSRKKTEDDATKAAGDSQQQTQSEASSTVSETAQLQTHSSGSSDADGDSEGKPKPRKRRRRRRGPRKSTDGNSGSDGGKSGAAPSGGGDA